jgi:hypothetical protein
MRVSFEWRMSCSVSSTPAINIVEPDDVVLAEVASGPHVDQFERDPARIGETIHRADRM